MIRDALRSVLVSVVLMLVGCPPASAQMLHGCAIGIGCHGLFSGPSKACVGEQVRCDLQTVNEDDFGDPYSWDDGQIILSRASGITGFELIVGPGIILPGTDDSATLGFIFTPDETDVGTPILATGLIQMHDIPQPAIGCSLGFPDQVVVTDCGTPPTTTTTTLPPGFTNTRVTCECRRSRRGKLSCRRCAP